MRRGVERTHALSSLGVPRAHFRSFSDRCEGAAAAIRWLFRSNAAYSPGALVQILVHLFGIVLRQVYFSNNPLADPRSPSGLGKIRGASTR